MIIIMSCYHTENGDQVFGFSICRRCRRQFCSCWLHRFPAHDRHGLDVGCGMIGRKHRLPASIGERLAFVSLYDTTKVQWVSQNRKQQQHTAKGVHSSRRGGNFAPKRKILSSGTTLPCTVSHQHARDISMWINPRPNNTRCPRQTKQKSFPFCFKFKNPQLIFGSRHIVL